VGALGMGIPIWEYKSYSGYVASGFVTGAREERR
jgi:hypothetical protein